MRATTSVENKLGDFYLSKDQDILIPELVDTRSKIVVKMNEISTYYYDLYVNKFNMFFSNFKHILLPPFTLYIYYTIVWWHLQELFSLIKQ